ncbi:MAG: hypothetical protein RL112_83, partial [Planctomycetota bacterium]
VGVLGRQRLEQPLDFKAGGDDVIPGVARAVVGMAQGEIKLLARVHPHGAIGEARHDVGADEITR